MNQPNITIHPLWHAVASDRSTCLDILLEITPPLSKVQKERTPLNLEVVIDRSGSMSGKKLKAAKAAACYAIEQLTPQDRVGIIAFDERVTTIVPNLVPLNKTAIQEWINRIEVGGSTALYEGWLEGACQVLEHYQTGLNRVLIISDGQANVGETNPDAIANQVHRLTKKGISTTTLGVGIDYNEDLMESMAKSGDGNYYFIEDAAQLPAIFAAELNGLVATYGQRVSLGITPKGNVTVLDVFNDFDKLPSGRFKLPNLLHGYTFFVALRLQVPEREGKDVSLCDFRLAWDDPNSGDRYRHSLMLTLPVVPGYILDEQIPEPLVKEQVALLLASRARKEAVAAMDRGDERSFLSLLNTSAACLMSSPMTAEIEAELEGVKQLEQEFKTGEHAAMRKRALSQSYNRSRHRRMP